MRGRTVMTVLLTCLFCSVASAQHTLEMIEDNGPASNRIDLLVMGDGYAADDQDDLANDALAAIDSLFESWPFREYSSFFNVALLSTVSNESGSDHPGESVFVDTFYGCAYDCAGLDRLICCDDAAVFQAAAEEYPAFDAILLIVNDSEYGGSGGAIAVVSNSPQAALIPPHEFGHTFGYLGDEYDDPYPGYTCLDIFPNVSFTSDRDTLKWNHWVMDETPLPTPDSAALTSLDPVGAFEGACYQETGMFRPVYECVMRALGEGMCPVCTEALVLAFYGYVEPIDHYSPAELSLSGTQGDSFAFSASTIAPDPDTLHIFWTIDGDTTTWADGDEFELPIECLEQGDHAVAVTVSDLTNMVRDDPDELMLQSVAWTVTRTDDGPVVDCDEADTDSDSDSDTADPLQLTPIGSSGDSGCGCATAAVGGSSLMKVMLEGLF